MPLFIYSDLPNVAWTFGRLSTDADLLVQVCIIIYSICSSLLNTNLFELKAPQRQHDPVEITFQTVRVIIEERVHRLENDSAVKMFKG